MMELFTEDPLVYKTPDRESLFGHPTAKVLLVKLKNKSSRANWNCTEHMNNSPHHLDHLILGTVHLRYCKYGSVHLAKRYIPLAKQPRSRISDTAVNCRTNKAKAIVEMETVDDNDCWTQLMIGCGKSDMVWGRRMTVTQNKSLDSELCVSWSIHKDNAHAFGDLSLESLICISHVGKRTCAGTHIQGRCGPGRPGKKGWGV